MKRIRLRLNPTEAYTLATGLSELVKCQFFSDNAKLFIQAFIDKIHFQDPHVAKISTWIMLDHYQLLSSLIMIAKAKRELVGPYKAAAESFVQYTDRQLAIQCNPEELEIANKAICDFIDTYPKNLLDDLPTPLR